MASKNLLPMVRENVNFNMLRIGLLSCSVVEGRGRGRGAGRGGARGAGGGRGRAFDKHSQSGKTYVTSLLSLYRTS